MVLDKTSCEVLHSLSFFQKVKNEPSENWFFFCPLALEKILWSYFQSNNVKQYLVKAPRVSLQWVTRGNFRPKLRPTFVRCPPWFFFFQNLVLWKAVLLCYEHRGSSNKRCPFRALFLGEKCISERRCLRFLK